MPLVLLALLVRVVQLVLLALLDPLVLLGLPEQPVRVVQLER